MPYIKKSPEQEKLWELAQKVPGASWVLPDPYNPASYVMPVGGLTKQAVSKGVVEKLFGYGAPKGLNKELSDLLKVVAATPKRAIEHIKEFRFIPGKTTTGTYHPDALSVFSHEFPSTMAGTYAHEAGHGASLPMAGKIRMRKGGVMPSKSAEEVGQVLAQDPFLKEHFEGVAEYLGKAMQEKAGVTPSVAFGYGGLQKQTFEELGKMPSKNPYMNAYRYLQNLLDY